MLLRERLKADGDGEILQLSASAAQGLDQLAARFLLSFIMLDGLHSIEVTKRGTVTTLFDAAAASSLHPVPRIAGHTSTTTT